MSDLLQPEPRYLVVRAHCDDDTDNDGPEFAVVELNPLYVETLRRRDAFVKGLRLLDPTVGHVSYSGYECDFYANYYETWQILLPDGDSRLVNYVPEYLNETEPADSHAAVLHGDGEVRWESWNRYSGNLYYTEFVNIDMLLSSNTPVVSFTAIDFSEACKDDEQIQRDSRVTVSLVEIKPDEDETEEEDDDIPGPFGTHQVVDIG